MLLNLKEQLTSSIGRPLLSLMGITDNSLIKGARSSAGVSSLKELPKGSKNGSKYASSTKKKNELMLKWLLNNRQSFRIYKNMGKINKIADFVQALEVWNTVNLKVEQKGYMIKAIM